MEDIALEEYQHAESIRLVERAIQLNVGGWPDDASMYEDRENRLSELKRLNEKGFEYLRDKTDKEEKRRREAWKDWLGMIATVVTSLIGLGGVIIGIVSVSC